MVTFLTQVKMLKSTIEIIMINQKRRDAADIATFGAALLYGFGVSASTYAGRTFARVTTVAQLIQCQTETIVMYACAEWKDGTPSLHTKKTKIPGVYVKACYQRLFLNVSNAFKLARILFDNWNMLGKPPLYMCIFLLCCQMVDIFGVLNAYLLDWKC